MKYIIKNCPANYQNNCRSAKVNSYICQDCTDCPFKQIVDECRGLIWQNEEYIKISDILDLLEIEEVNE